MDDDTSRDTTECKEIKLDSPSVNRTIKSLPSRQSGIDKALAAMAIPSFAGIASQVFAKQSVIDNSLAAMAKPIALESAMQAFSSQQAVIDNAMAAIARPSFIDIASQVFAKQSVIDNSLAAMAKPIALESAMQAFSSQQAVIDNAMAAIARPSFIDIASQVFAKQSVIDNSLAAMAKPIALESAMQAFSSQQAVIDNAMAAIADSSSLAHAIKSFATASSVFLSDSSYLSEMAQVISAVNMESVNASSIERELESTESKFNLVENGKNFLSTFKSLPPLIQFILFAFLMNVILPQVNSISANLLTPLVENYLESNKKSDRQKIKDIKKIPLTLNDIDTTDLRFITGNNVRLRANPSTNAEIYDELVLGQIVTVLAKKRNWVEVMYEYEGGESMSGWVFTRHTAKFVK